MVIQAQEHSTDELERYCCATALNSPVVNSQGVLVYSWLSECTVTMSADVARLLPFINRFDTIDNHVAALQAELRLQGNSEEAVCGLLKQLIEGQLMISLSRYSAGFLPKPLSQVAAVIESVGIPTRQWSRTARRALYSCVKNAQMYGRRPDFVVVDGEENEDVAITTVAALRQYGSATGSSILYCSKADRQRYAKRLARASGVQSDIVEFALLGAADASSVVGASRNTLLLHTAGTLSMSVDDDIVCRLSPSKNVGRGLCLHSGNPSIPSWFFANRTAVKRDTDFSTTDILALHERLLGRNINACLKDTSHLTCNRAEPSVYRAINNSTARVLVTMLGLIGDCGSSLPYAAWVCGESRQRLLASRDHYEASFLSREVKRVVDTDTIATGPAFMTYACGFDNRRLLPPFFPVQRDSDGIFGELLRAVCTDGYVGHLPWAIAHFPSSRPLYSPDSRWEYGKGFTTADILKCCIRSCPLNGDGSTTAEGLSTVGQHLSSLASLSEADFSAFLTGESLKLLSSVRTVLFESLHATEEYPDFWTEDVHRLLALFERSVKTHSFLIPRDLLGSVQSGTELLRVQLWMRQYGELLRVWPELVGLAQLLTTQEVVPAASVQRTHSPG